MKPGETAVCTRCGHVGVPEGAGCSALLFGISLFCLFVIPGVIFFVYIANTYPRCSKCDHKDGLVPADSPVGRRFVMENAAEPVKEPIRAAQTLKEYRERRGLN